MAGIAVGYWSSTDEIKRSWSVDRVFLPSIDEIERTDKIKGWKRAVSYALKREEE